jgi:hypothetical protein
MADTLVALIEALRIDTVELPHPVGEIAIGSFHDQMVMGIHETKGMAEPVVMVRNIRQKVEKACAVGIIGVDRRTGVPATGHVVEGSREFNASGSGHEKRLIQKHAGFKT